MSNVSKDKLKERIRRTSSAHEQLIDPVPSGETTEGETASSPTRDATASNASINVHSNVNVAHNVGDYAYQKGVGNVDHTMNINAYVAPRVHRRPRFEDVYVRQSVYVERVLVEELNRRAAGEKGEKTRIINEALRFYFEHVPPL